MRLRLTGVSTAAAGVQWEYLVGDAEVARRVVSILEDRRMLWLDYAWELPEECVASASKARDALTEQINTLGIGDDLTSSLKAIRRAFADFTTTSPRRGQDGFFEFRALEESLAVLRAVVGQHLGEIAWRYGLDVDEQLAQIVTPVDGWFWEKFPD